MPLRLRTSTNRRKGKAYTYHQLVRAVRKNGTPTHEVVAHLGRLSDDEARAIRDGLKDLKAEPTADPSEILVSLKDVVALAAPRYLDLAVVHELWKSWGLPEFFAEHFPARAANMAARDVVFILVANRCVAPCSKLRVTEWVPRTALPELLGGFEPSKVNNTRIHRVLKGLEGIEPVLTRFLVQHPRRRARGDAVIFLDLTSSWFEGHGGSLGVRGRTKDGAVRRHTVQIALAVDGSGLPLRWEVLPGNVAEATVLPTWIGALAEHNELTELPLVFDRGLASETNIVALLEAGRKFVTCAPMTRVDSWDTEVDLDALVSLPDDELTPERLVELGLRATEDDDTFHADRGVKPPPRMDTVPDPGLRIVPYFRPSLCRRNRESLRRLHDNIERRVEHFNEELRVAKRSRTEAATRNKIVSLLQRFGVEDAYTVHLEPQTTGKTKSGKPIRSFQIRVEPVEHHTPRQLNAGWMLLLAHPDDARAPLELIGQYHHKEVVEHAFGIIKSFVAMRPFRHQTDPNIRTHVTLCVLALLLDRDLELRLRGAGISDAVDRVYEMLESCRLQVLTTRKGSASRFTRTTPDRDQLRLLKTLGFSDLAKEEFVASLPSCRY